MNTRRLCRKFVVSLRRKGLHLGGAAVLFWVAGLTLWDARGLFAADEARPVASPEVVLETEPAPSPVPESPVLPEEKQRWEEEGVSEEYGGGATRVVLRGILGEGRYTYNVLDNPARLYVDVRQPGQMPVSDRFSLKGEAFQRLRLGRYPDRLRLTFYFRSESHADPVVAAEGKDLVVSAAGAGPAGLAIAPMGGREVPLEEPRAAAKAVAVAQSDWKPMRVTGIEYHHGKASADVVISTAGKPLDYVKDEGLNIVVTLPGAEIPSHLRRPIDTSAFPSAVLNVIPEQVGTGASGFVRVTIVLRSKAPYEVFKENGSVRVQVQLPETPPLALPLPAPSLPENQEGLVRKAEAPARVVEASPRELPAARDRLPEPSVVRTLPPAPLPAALPAVAPAPRRGAESAEAYKGSKISLDFKDADIQNVLRLIAEVSGKNIVISDAVQGKVTIRLINVPWDLAMDVVLKTYALDKEELAPNIMRVAPYTQLRTERDEALKAAQALQQVESLVTEVIPVNYAKAQTLAPMLERVKSSRAEASILVDSRTNAIVLKDLPKAIEEMTRLIRELDMQTPQVLIEAKIVELEVEYERELGIQWGTLYKAGPATGNPTGMNFPHTANIGGVVDNISGVSPTGIANPVVNLPAGVSDAAGGALGFSLSSITNSFKLDLQLSALEKDNHARILSSPRVATLNNQEARIEQGREIPFQTTSDEGTKTEFKDAMLRLAVTPQINFDKSIIMKIVVSNDTPIQDPTVGYIIGKKEAATSVLVSDGDTAVIGGIYTNSDQDSGGGIPWFMDAPGLGNLFKKSKKADKRSELVIFITPRIVPATQLAAEDWTK